MFSPEERSSKFISREDFLRLNKSLLSWSTEHLWPAEYAQCFQSPAIGSYSLFFIPVSIPVVLCKGVDRQTVDKVQDLFNMVVQGICSSSWKQGLKMIKLSAGVVKLNIQHTCRQAHSLTGTLSRSGNRQLVTWSLKILVHKLKELKVPSTSGQKRLKGYSFTASSNDRLTRTYHWNTNSACYMYTI